MASLKSLRATRDKALSFDPTTLLTVTVGSKPHQQSFSVHESIICARSGFFRRAMNGDWVEKEQRLVKLPEDDPEVFALYINLVYANCIPSTQTDPQQLNKTTSEYVALTHLYVLSEKLQDTAAKNAAMDALWAMNKYDIVPSLTVKTINIIYAGTQKGSKGRQFLAELASTVTPNTLLMFENLVPKDFFFDLAICLHKDRSAKKVNIALNAESSRYHD